MKDPWFTFTIAESKIGFYGVFNAHLRVIIGWFPAPLSYPF